MSLQYKFFSIPLGRESDDEDELNAFLKGVQIVTVHRELICQESRYYWAIAVEYQAGGSRPKDVRKSELAKKKIDYREVLSPEDFAIYVKLRDWRKETAAREALQLFNVFMNEQLAAMIQKRVTTKSALKEIEGVGEARVAKYGDAVLAILKDSFKNLGAGTGNVNGAGPDKGQGQQDKGQVKGSVPNKVQFPEPDNEKSGSQSLEPNRV
ncbi:MAG: HRDC domain-containing protein, partial [Desulfamplus sp.]|nr:HRDC domain-containing protein [Desulfamplus sp.]